MHGFEHMDFPDDNTCSIYFDTKDYLLARRSIERPVYKEKFRLRTYGARAESGDVAFPEIKKKYDHVVYKRRIQMTYGEAYECLLQGSVPESFGQIGREISHMFELYPGLQPSALIAYRRDPYLAPGGIDLRVTFDHDIRFRKDRLDLRYGSDGIRIFPEDMFIMELKLPGVFPKWMADAIWSLGIEPTHFSKYGEAYRRFLRPGAEENLKTELKYTDLKTKQEVFHHVA